MLHSGPASGRNICSLFLLSFDPPQPKGTAAHTLTPCAEDRPPGVTGCWSPSSRAQEFPKTTARYMSPRLGLISFVFCHTFQWQRASYVKHGVCGRLNNMSRGAPGHDRRDTKFSKWGQWPARERLPIGIAAAVGAARLPQVLRPP